MYYVSKSTYLPIGSKQISTICPNCKEANCLELTFYQKHTNNGYIKKITKKISATLYCHHTNTEIPSVQWSDEIANYFDIEKDKVKKEPSGTTFTKVFYFLIIVLGLAIAIPLGYWAYSNANESNIVEAIHSPYPNLKVKAMFSDLEDNNINKNGFTWFLVEKVEADTIWLRRNKDISMEDGFLFDLNEAAFTEKTIKASYIEFKNKKIKGFRVGSERVKFSGNITDIKNK